MVATIEKGDFNVHHRVTHRTSGLHGFFDARLHRRNILPGNSPAFNPIDKLKAGATFQGFQLNGDVPKLAPAPPFVGQTVLRPLPTR